MNNHVLSAENLTLSYEEKAISTALNLHIPKGKITVILGPNACGKSTLLRGLSRLLPPKSGHVLLDGKNIQKIPTKQVAKTLGFLPQTSTAPAGITVSDLVARGRYPHQHFLRQWAESDDTATKQAMDATNVTDLADRVVDSLSGGQRQRVWIAMVLAQQTPVLLLDEPTTYLDVAHQLEVLELCNKINKEHGTTIVMVLHDLNQAAQYADNLVIMKQGEIVDSGAPKAVLTPETMAEVFGIEVAIQQHPVTDTPLIVPLRVLDN